MPFVFRYDKIWWDRYSKRHARNGVQCPECRSKYFFRRLLWILHSFQPRCHSCQFSLLVEALRKTDKLWGSLSSRTHGGGVSSNDGSCSRSLRNSPGTSTVSARLSMLEVCLFALRSCGKALTARVHTLAVSNRSDLRFFMRLKSTNICQPNFIRNFSLAMLARWDHLRVERL